MFDILKAKSSIKIIKRKVPETDKLKAANKDTEGKNVKESNK